MPSVPLATITLLLVAAASLLSGCDEKPTAPPPGAEPIAVDVAIATPSTQARSVQLTGRLEAYRTAEVRARVEGIVVQRTYVEGQEVKAGDLLFRIDPAPLQAELAAAEAERAQAHAASEAAADVAKRSRQLMEDDSISPQQYRKDYFAEQQARAAEKSAEAKVQSARLRLAYASVTTPIAGRARRALVSEGALVGQDEGTPLTKVEQIDPIYVNFAQPAGDYLALRSGLAGSGRGPAAARVSLRLSNGIAYALTGSLLFSDTAVDPKTDTVAMRALFDNPDHLLLPGMYVQVELALADAGQVLLIPQQALTRTREGAYVMLDDDGRARRREVRADSLEGKQWRVSDGLSAGERVILDGSALAEGQAVQAKPTPADARVGAER